MKYMIMLYGSQRDYDLMAGTGPASTGISPQDFAPMFEFLAAFNNDLAASGELVDAQGLDAPVHSRRIQLQDGVPLVTDGPYAETEEVLAGYTVVDCVSFDRATEIAARLTRCPSPGGMYADAYVDVRPITGGPPEPEA